jgi:uncharacterized protein YhfF
VDERLVRLGADRWAEFAGPGPLRDKLVDAVLRGAKTATSSLLADWEEEGEPVPVAGERQAVRDSAGAPVAVIEIVSVVIIRLGDADEALARDEGEGFRSVAEWRDAHEDFWLGEDRGEATLPDDTPVVVERFRLV